MIGSTDRCALKVQNPAYGLCSQGVNGVNSDVVMILHLNPANHSRLDPLHPARPLRPERPLRRRQQDRRRAVPGTGPADRRDRRGLRDPDPALRRAELRQLHQRGPGPRRHQDVLPRAGLRRLLGPEHPDDRLPPAERDPGAPGRAGPPCPVQGPRGHHDQPRLLAPGGAERHCAHPPGPRVPARPGGGRQGEGPQQPDHRPAARLRRRRAAHRRLGFLGQRHDQPGARRTTTST